MSPRIASVVETPFLEFAVFHQLFLVDRYDASASITSSS
jgi:hypothetical protein